MPDPTPVGRPRKTLQRAGNPLSLPQVQLATLGDATIVPTGAFTEQLLNHGVERPKSRGIEILQVNVGRVCNQTCSHCHVDAGPERRESMSRDVAEHVVRILDHGSIHTLDITGGAPEMNPNFRWLVEQARRKNKRVIDRCNLTILRAPGFLDLPEFLALQQVEIVASLPCYLEVNCDAQRGEGVFQKSLEALQSLNKLGYGREGSGLELSLVYNPVGWQLPPPQAQLEFDYREHLESNYGIQFTRLYTITNMPISRFLDDLLRADQYGQYMQKLIDAFNPGAVEGLMCRNMLSVDWQGNVYDCDFNQMLHLGVLSGGSHIADLDWQALEGREINLANHCFGCTAGAGSSCQGALT